MASYKKSVKGENISADEIGAHNYIQVFNDGSGKIIVCFFLLLATVALAYLWITMHVLLVVLMIGAIVVFSIIGVSAAVRHISNTRRQHLENEAAIEWSRILYRTETMVATLNRATHEITVHNAQEVSIQHHHAAAPMQITEHAESKSLMPKLSDLQK